MIRGAARAIRARALSREARRRVAVAVRAQYVADCAAFDALRATLKEMDQS